MTNKTSYPFHLVFSLLFFLSSEGFGSSLRTLEGIGIGPRALGMGGAFVALADDPTAVYWNPAGLAFVEKPTIYGEISGRKRVHVVDDVQRYIWYNSPDFSNIIGPLRDLWGPSGRVTTDLISVAYPFQGSVMAISHQRPFEKYALNEWGELSDLVVRETSLILAAKKNETFAFGLSIGTSQMEIHYTSSTNSEDFTGQGYSLGAGFLFRPDSAVSFGFTIQPETKFSGKARLKWGSCWDPPCEDERQVVHETLYRSQMGLVLKPKDRIRIAAGFNLPPNSNEDIIFLPNGYSFNSIRTVFPSIRVGVEYWLLKSFPLRLGAFHMEDETALTFGSGLRKGSFSTDIAFIRFPSEDRHETRGILSLFYAFQK